MTAPTKGEIAAALKDLPLLLEQMDPRMRAAAQDCLRVLRQAIAAHEAEKRELRGAAGLAINELEYAWSAWLEKDPDNIDPERVSAAINALKRACR